jgi:hypothetical protein
MSEEAKPVPAKKPRAKRTPKKPVIATEKAAIAPEVVAAETAKPLPSMKQASDVIWGLVSLACVVVLGFIAVEVIQAINRPDSTPDVEVVAEDSAKIASQAFVTAYREGLSSVYAEAAKGKFKDLQEVNDFLKPKRQKVIDEAFQPIAKELEGLNGDKFNEDKFRKVFEGLSKGFVE